ncbi:hypothetical protein [Streptomyces sp. NRRL S-15]|uniref:hypothetical protein n=1 Tax=Streptomyces sp. NRRL S-15 TaxID=1463886 RepID=UPI0004C60468|nr:hypothetical protein [Streptomyces sp. NRRL S-15]
MNTGTIPSRSHTLMVLHVDFVGAGRSVVLRSGLNLVHGNITTGKTTFVRLLRALLGTVPSGLPSETEAISDIRAELLLGSREWLVSRPLVVTRTAPVDVAEKLETEDSAPSAFRVPAAGSKASFGRFLLEQTGIPVVSVPQARSKPTEGLSPVTITDWLGYCVVTGDEIDSQVFGHMHPFRDQKRRWVFELTYGLYDAEVAHLVADLKRIDAQINSIERESELQEKFLAETPFADRNAIVDRVAEIDDMLSSSESGAAAAAASVIESLDVGELRSDLLGRRSESRKVAEDIRRNEAQVSDLRDLRAQLKSQFSRLTRAVISDEWLVDFDFIVCPRCGNDVAPSRSTDDCCYLCLQQPRPSATRESFLAEQDRIVGQIQETDVVIASREKSLEALRSRHANLAQQERVLAAQLNSRTEAFISDNATEMQSIAARRAYLMAEKSKLADFALLIDRFEQTMQSKQELEERKLAIQDSITEREFGESTAEAKIHALEEKLLAYLTKLNIPTFSEDLSVVINRKTYLPEISGRTFDELSSQGLKTLVNVAHSLAHHAVAIDLGLPLPGLLVLDGLSANAGRRGFDEARIHDMYRLLLEVAAEYGDRLQIIAVDNDPPSEFWGDLEDKVVLHLTQEDKLVRFS